MNTPNNSETPVTDKKEMTPDDYREIDKWMGNDSVTKLLDKSYNQGIDHAIQIVMTMNKHWPWHDDQDGEFLISFDDLISQLNELKKP